MNSTWMYHIRPRPATLASGSADLRQLLCDHFGVVHSGHGWMLTRQDLPRIAALMTRANGASAALEELATLIDTHGAIDVWEEFCDA